MEPGELPTRQLLTPLAPPTTLTALNPKQLRHHHPRPTFNHMRKRRGIQWFFRSNINSARPALPRPMHKIRRRINRSRSAHHNHQRGLADLILDAIHLQRNLSEENDVWPHPSSAGAAAHLVQAAINRTGGLLHSRSHLDLASSPCICTSLTDPARSCRSSTFCVHKKNRSPSRASSSASATCAGFG